MRILILTIAGVITLTSLNAQQNDLAFQDLSTIEFEDPIKLKREVSTKRKNSIYLETKAANQESKTVNYWKQKIAAFDLKNTTVYYNSEKATYRIKFKNQQVKIVTVYDNNGGILASKEMFSNIKIPHKLRILISKENPGWSFAKNTYYVAYNKEQGIEKQQYKIQIRQGNTKKTLKFDKNFKSI